MADRRTARASRLLDPVWHQLRDALDKIYAEIESGATIGGLSVIVGNQDGSLVSYAVQFDRPSAIERYIVADGQGLLDAFETSMINATPGDPDLGGEVGRG